MQTKTPTRSAFLSAHLWTGRAYSSNRIGFEARRPINGQRGIEGEANSASKNKNTISGHDLAPHCDYEEC
ncbi:MAG: hypothetical protein WCE27_25625, partial [Pseudolabrys sp.]